MRKLATISIVLLCSGTGFAQTNSTSGFKSGSIFSSSSPTAGSSMNSSSTSSGTGTSTSGSVLSSNFSQGFTATGISNPFGTTTTGRTGMGGMGMGGMGMGGMGMGMGGMGMMGMGMGGMGMGGMGMGGMGMNRNQQNMRGGTTGQQYQLRPTVKLGFTPAVTPVQARSQQIITNMARIPAAEKFAGANVTIQGRTAVVSGSIEEGQIEVFKRLLQLEPGIDNVDVSQVNLDSDSSPVRAGAEPIIPAEATQK
ncbi:MAG: hypothetical protein U0930_23760 [Pirellulales bacterium]